MELFVLLPTTAETALQTRVAPQDSEFLVPHIGFVATILKSGKTHKTSNLLFLEQTLLSSLTLGECLHLDVVVNGVVLASLFTWDGQWSAHHLSFDYQWVASSPWVEDVQLL